MWFEEIDCCGCNRGGLGKWGWGWGSRGGGERVGGLSSGGGNVDGEGREGNNKTLDKDGNEIDGDGDDDDGNNVLDSRPSKRRRQNQSSTSSTTSGFNYNTTRPHTALAGVHWLAVGGVVPSTSLNISSNTKKSDANGSLPPSQTQTTSQQSTTLLDITTGIRISEVLDCVVAEELRLFWEMFCEVVSSYISSSTSTSSSNNSNINSNRNSNSNSNSGTAGGSDTLATEKTANPSGMTDKYNRLLFSLQTSPSIQELAPFFSVYIFDNVTQSLQSSPSSSDDGDGDEKRLRTIIVCLETINSLLNNPSVHLGLHLHQILPSVLSVSVSKSFTNNKNINTPMVCKTKRLAGAVVGDIVQRYGKEYPGIMGRCVGVFLRAAQNQNNEDGGDERGGGYGNISALLGLLSLSPQVVYIHCVKNGFLAKVWSAIENNGGEAVVWREAIVEGLARFFYNGGRVWDDDSGDSGAAEEEDEVAEEKDGKSTEDGGSKVLQDSTSQSLGETMRCVVPFSSLVWGEGEGGVGAGGWGEVFI